jgi:hypothetical protein
MRQKGREPRKGIMERRFRVRRDELLDDAEVSSGLMRGVLSRLETFPDSFRHQGQDAQPGVCVPIQSYGTQPTGQIAALFGTVHSLGVAAPTAERATPRRERRSRKESRGGKSRQKRVVKGENVKKGGVYQRRTAPMRVRPTDPPHARRRPCRSWRSGFPTDQLPAAFLLRGRMRPLIASVKVGRRSTGNRIAIWFFA